MQYYIQTDKSYLGKVDVDIDELLNQCVIEIDGLLDVRPPIMLYGKVVAQTRNVGFFSDQSIGYYYSRKLAPSKPMTPSLTIMLQLINDKFQTDFNGILINEYLNGMDKICAHSDDEASLSDAGVVCISYGASRKFRIRNKLTKLIVCDVQTNSNEILVMGGDFQKEFTHEIPQEKTIKDRRISFTFRKHLH